MCTGIALKLGDGKHLLGRSLDIPYEFGQQVMLVPRNLELRNAIDESKFKTKYAILGMGTLIDNHPMLADGVNEKGLACAGLNFGALAVFEKEAVEGKVNIGSYDFITWVLTNHETVAQLKETLKDLILVDKNFNAVTAPAQLHWIIYDKNGDCIVVEKEADGLHVYDNKIGVMTNLPNFKWHMTNLTQYMRMQPKESGNLNWGECELEAFSQGSGNFGIPGDYTSPSRFVRASFLKTNIKYIDNELDGVTGLFHVFSSCDVPLGSVVSTNDMLDKTVYTACMCLESGVYYYHNYYNRQITAIDMKKENLDSKEVKLFGYRNKQAILFEN